MPVTDDSPGVRRVLVTGASGYVGGRLVPELLGAGYEVRCLARSPAKLEGRSWSDRVEVVAGDVADRAAVLEAMRERGRCVLPRALDGRDRGVRRT